MAALLRHYTFSLVFTAACLIAAAWYGWSSSGSIGTMLSILWIVFVLSILEISLSFDNAVVNATVLREMDPVWQRRFLTWGILIAVFGMRIVFPIAIVAIAAGIGPWEAVQLSLDDPVEYERIVSGAHISIAGFGGAFLAMVGLNFFFDADKEVHWIAAIERRVARFSSIPSFEIGLVLLLVYAISTFLTPSEAYTFLISAVLGLVTYIAVNAIGRDHRTARGAQEGRWGEIVRSGRGRIPVSGGARRILQLRRRDRRFSPCPTT